MSTGKILSLIKALGGEGGTGAASSFGSHGDLAGGNLDDIKTAGFYNLVTKYTYENTPAGLTNGMLVVYSVGSSIVQLFFGKAAGNGLYTRRYIGGAWKSWATYATVDDIPDIPEPTSPYQQLVTDGEGKAGWEERLGYKYLAPSSNAKMNETVEFTDGKSSYKAWISETFLHKGEYLLRVVFDGADYDVLEHVDLTSGYTGYIGNAALNPTSTGENTGEPFLFLYAGYNNYCTIYTNAGDGEHTIAVYQLEETTHPIPAEYLTGAALTEEDNGKLLGIVDGKVALAGRPAPIEAYFSLSSYGNIVGTAYEGESLYTFAALEDLYKRGHVRTAKLVTGGANHFLQLAGYVSGQGMCYYGRPVDANTAMGAYDVSGFSGNYGILVSIDSSNSVKVLNAELTVE